MNKTIRRASVFTLLLVFALLIRATWVQFYDGQALADDNDNRRNAIETYSAPLGNIIVGGKSVTGSARTKGGDLEYKRTYTDGELYAAVTGYASQAYAPTQLEGIYADLLNGTDSRLKTVMDTVTNQRAEPGQRDHDDRPVRAEGGVRRARRQEGRGRRDRPEDREDPRGRVDPVVRPVLADDANTARAAPGRSSPRTPRSR